VRESNIAYAWRYGVEMQMEKRDMFMFIVVRMEMSNKAEIIT
jgi:hypothetical protein